MLFVLSAGIVAIFLCWRVWTRPRGRSDISLVPMPPHASWLWGHEKIVLDSSAGEAYTNWFKALNTRMLRIRGAFQMPDILVVGDTTALAHIMQKNIYDYHHSAVVRPRMARLLGKSLVWAEGASEHKRMRAFFLPSLSPHALRQCTADFLHVSGKLTASLEALCFSQTGSVRVNILDWLGPATLEIIGRYGFGHDFSQADDGKLILSSWRKMATMGMSRKGIVALLLLRRFSFLNSLPLKALKDQGNVRRTIHKHVGRQMVSRDEATGDVKGNDMLSGLLTAHADGTLPTEELMDHIVLFIMAGSETSAQTLGYAIWELSRNPDKQARLRDEIATFSGEPSYDDFQTRLPYLDAVVREAVRVHPVVPYMERVATQDDVLPLGRPFISPSGHKVTEIFIRAGQTIIFPVHSVNRDDDAWTDGASFRPERWFEALPPQDLLTKGWSNTLTFSDGPRTCVGYRLAVIQIKVILFSLTRKFAFHDTGITLTHKVTSSMQPCPEGKAEEGPNMPIDISLLDMSL